MPELPEVETIRRDLVRCIVGRRICEVSVNDVMVVRMAPKEFSRRLIGKNIVDVKRRGKAIVIELNDKSSLVIQLAMTGQLIYGKDLPNTRVIFKLSNGKYLNYNDQRRFGRLYVVKDLSEVAFFRTLGIEPLSRGFDLRWLSTKLRLKKTPIKSLLMDQNFIAGIGNIYASEILFRARIHPQKRATSLTEKEVAQLRQITVNVLKEAIKLRGSSVNTYRDTNGQKGSFVRRIQVYGRESEECLICKKPIKRIVQAGRSTFFCPGCQKKTHEKSCQN